jgi:hypothetical protein
MVILGVLGVLGMIAPGPVIHVFRDDPEVVRIGATALRFQCVAVLFQPFTVTANMMFQSVGRSREASFLATLRSGLCYVPLLLILPRFMGLLGIQSAQMWSDLLTLLICLPFVVRFFAEIPEDEWKTFVFRICALEGYSYVILDLSENIHGIFGILRMSDRIYTLTRHDRVAKRKTQNYENILKIYKYEDILDKSIRCSPPSVNKVPSITGETYGGDFIDYIRDQLGAF